MTSFRGSCFAPRDQRVIAMKLHLLDLSSADLPLVARWLHAAHVRPAWGDPAPLLAQLREPPGPGQWRAVIEAEGRKVGLVLWQHPTRAELDLAGLTDIPASVIDIDIMIGEVEAVGAGLGSRVIRQLAVAALADPQVPFVIGCTAVHNLASRRAFEKAGFRLDREFDDVPNGPHLLMVCHRGNGTGA